MSLVPMVRVPLNIMCSKKWLMPVMPARSFTEPTCATQPAAMVGDSWRSKSSQRMPLGSVSSWTLICGFSAAAAGSAGAQREQPQGKVAGRDHVHAIELQKRDG